MPSPNGMSASSLKADNTVQGKRDRYGQQRTCRKPARPPHHPASLLKILRFRDGLRRSCRASKCFKVCSGREPRLSSPFRGIDDLTCRIAPVVFRSETDLYFLVGREVAGGD